MRIAVMRQTGRSLSDGERTHVDRVPIDVERLHREHAAYRELLLGLGWSVLTMPELASCPDAVFVEDTAVVLDEIAIICRPGAPSRRAEVASIRARLAAYRPVADILPPGTIDGGDVLVIDHRIWVGLSSRTNEEAAAQVRDIAEPLGYQVRTIAVRHCLHLKSAATAAGPRHVVVNPEWVPPETFDGLEVVSTDPSEPHGANVLYLGDVVAVATAHPRTRDRIAESGLAVVSIDAAEVAKAEGGLTCCSLLVREQWSDEP